MEQFLISILERRRLFNLLWCYDFPSFLFCIQKCQLWSVEDVFRKMFWQLVVYFLGSQDLKTEVYFNKTEFKKEQMQRVYQYLKTFQDSPHTMNNFTFISNTVEDDFADYIKILIK